ncbi:MAG: ParB/RepB/Spo0J family partition protein, partial [Bacillota bacterium]|nr:ParB/RepB/Spo0J family partition protein [Bacillota bacterium]
MFAAREKRAELPIEKITVNPEQPRKVFEMKELEELRDSILEFGVIQPILVKRREEGQYFLIAGERRLRAAAMAGMEKIPAIIREADDRDTALIALVENVQRENLNYIEEAAAYRRLMEEYGLTQGEIARRVGKQQSTISNKIRLLTLPVELQATLARHQLSERHARALLKLENDQQRQSFLDKIIHYNLNVKQSEKLIEDFLAKRAAEVRSAEKRRCINYKIYINTLRKAFSFIQEAEKDACYQQEDKGD